MFKNLKSFFGTKDAPKATDSAPPRPSAPTPNEGKTPVAKLPESKPTVKTPEELCGITPKMAKDEVREQLALLYKRYNRATSSLDTTLKGEAEMMLDAIVVVREKVFGPI
jgi:hypothetical protein